MNLAIEPDLEALSRKAADIIIRAGNAAITQQGRYALALCGGRTAKPILQQLAALQRRERFDWSRVAVFWVDERCVPPTHPDSNYQLAWTEWLRQVPIGEVYRMRGEATDPETAAQEYERLLHTVFHLQEGELPQLDLVLLGVGEDGHIASLFPQSSALHEVQRLVVAPYVSRLSSYRLTLTLPVLNSASCRLIVIAGEQKRAVVERLRQRKDADEQLPVEYLRTEVGDTVWLVERAAYEP